MTGIGVSIGSAAGRAIDVFELELDSGALHRRASYATSGEVQWLAGTSDRTGIFAALGTDPPRVATLRRSPNTGLLEEVGSGPLAAPMAYLSTDRTGNHLFGASYTDSFVTVSRLPSTDAPAAGNLRDDHAAGMSGPAPGITAQRSPGQHAHCALVSPDNRFVYATALGDDRIAWWPFDAATGKLGVRGEISTAAGSGPRHLLFSRTGERLYVIHEMSGTIAVYARDTSGTLTGLQTITSIPDRLGLVPGTVRDGSAPAPEPNAVWCAELRLTPNGSFLYSTERSSSTITRFSVDSADGRLRYIDNIATETQPRGMNIDPTGAYLLVCGEVSSQVSVYRIDSADGGLSRLGRYTCQEGPRCIEFTVNR